MISRTSWLSGVPFGAAIVALAMLCIAAPPYLIDQGFPLDDAWIHAVYGRELARSGMLAYNPGVPATGETAPLWALMLGAVHWLTGDPPSAVTLTKAVGFTLHVASAVLLGLALAGSLGRTELPWVAAAALVAVHPDLIAASVSGMEVPLATLVVVAAVGATLRAKPAWLVLVGAAAVAGRPETALFAAGFPLAFWARDRPAVAVRLSAAAAGGAMSGVLLLGLRNYAVSGLFLPATYHAKVDVRSSIALQAQLEGFRGLLGQLPLVNWDVALATLGLLSAVLLGRAATGPAGRAGAAMYVGGVAYCAVSFVLVRPVDPFAFYHQRYVLPAVFVIVAALPLLAHEVLRPLPGRAFRMAAGAALVLMFGIVVTASPARYRRLANDARNIDDVQVAFGRALASASPSEIAWVVDAGAARFFGRPFVVDLIGLNTPGILGPEAQAFLDGHPPRYLDLFPTWSHVETESGASMPARSFETSTAYTVTRYPDMRRHVLISCEPAGTRGRITVRERVFAFRCPK